jgi:hypothetical protein
VGRRAPARPVVDRGDIVMLDSVAGTRRQITRTTGNEGKPAVGAP